MPDTQTTAAPKALNAAERTAAWLMRSAARENARSTMPLRVAIALGLMLILWAAFR